MLVNSLRGHKLRHVYDVGGGGGDADFPNQPAGTVLTDYDMSDSVPVANGQQIGSSGWFTNNSGGGVTLGTDATAPVSPSSMFDYLYPAGFGGGSAPGVVYYDLGGRSDLFVGFTWKPSSVWDGHGSAVNKIVFVIGATFVFNVYLMMYGTAAPYVFAMNLEMSTSNGHLTGFGNFGDDPGSWIIFQNTGQGHTISLGSWHKMEMRLKKSTNGTSQNGLVTIWVNNVKLFDYTTVNFGNENMAEIKFDPTWGGVGETKAQADHYYFDHVRVVIPS